MGYVSACGKQSVVERGGLDTGTLEVTDIHNKKSGGFQAGSVGEAAEERVGSGASFPNNEDGSRKLWEGGSETHLHSNLLHYFNWFSLSL